MTCNALAEAREELQRRIEAEVHTDMLHHAHDIPWCIQKDTDLDYADCAGMYWVLLRLRLLLCCCILSRRIHKKPLPVGKVLQSGWLRRFADRHIIFSCLVSYHDSIRSIRMHISTSQYWRLITSHEVRWQGCASTWWRLWPLP